MPLDNGTLLNGVLRSKLLNNPFASYSFIDLDFSQTHTTYFDNKYCSTTFVCYNF